MTGSFTQPSYGFIRNLSKHWEDFYRGDISGWEHIDVIEAEVTAHKRCETNINGEMVVLQSEVCGRARGSSSYFVLVSYTCDDKVENYIAKIKQFLRLEPPYFSTQLQILFLAVADMFNAEATWDRRKRLRRLFKVSDLHNAVFTDYPIKVEDIREPLITCLSDDSSSGFFILEDPDEDI